MKKTAMLLTLCMLMTTLCACVPEESAISGGNGGEEQQQQVTDKLYARFMTNGDEENVTLSSGYEAVGDDLLFDMQEITKGGKLTVPSGAPTRNGFVFSGWAVDADGTKLWNFDDKVYSCVTLYAKWERSEETEKVEYVEPKLSFKETVDDSEPLKLTGVLNSFVKNGAVSLTKIGLRRLADNADNVKELLNYTIATGVTITSATYVGNAITVTYHSGGEEQSTVIRVNDVTESLKVDNATYESKAAKYEQKVSLPPYSVVMAGSSSMENWSTSVEDMKPVTTANVGIGGTIVKQWTERLAPRLIYPLNPRAVVFYLGINNIINSKMTGEATGNDIVELFEEVHLHLPDAQIYFILINKVPGYTSYYGEMDIANAAAINFAANNSYVTLIDAGTKLEKATGKGNAAYFLTDGLHMSLCGYVIWGKEVKNSFIAKEREIYGL
ncbi:MAG: InlB B-repeat-containing protein [Clostridia bacterium]|nr:InlB B-repeat-containing protein [Clostridia bacterium]